MMTEVQWQHLLIFPPDIHFGETLGPALSDKVTAIRTTAVEDNAGEPLSVALTDKT